MKLFSKFYLVWLSVFVWFGTLLYLSFQTDEGTVKTSSRLATVVYGILFVLGIELSYSMIHGMRRTTAHIVVF